MSRRTVALAAGLSLAVAATAAVATVQVVGNPLAAPEPASSPTLSATPTPTPSPAPTVLAAGDTGADPRPGKVAELLDGPLSDIDQSGQVGAVVADLATGEVAYERAGSTPLTPASALKLVTAAAVLEVLGPAWRFRTRVVTKATPAGTGREPVTRGAVAATGDARTARGHTPTGAGRTSAPISNAPADEADTPAELILVGGGDPTLATVEPRMPRATSLDKLAQRTADKLVESGTTSVRLRFDDSLFSGPAVSPAWEPGYVPSGVAAPVSALAVDGGRLTPGLRARSDDPAMATAVAFAGMLEDRGIAVEGEPARASAPSQQRTLAAVESVPLAEIVEHVIATSDNDAAEILFRHVALGLGQPGSAAAASTAVVDVLDRLGVDAPGVIALDGSGLARGSAVPASVLVDLLVAAAEPGNPALRPILTGLPVAAFNGTLDERVTQAPGLVRAKTGTLTGVHTLAGLVTAADGVTYAFAVLANGTPDALETRAALDAVGAALARCGCARPDAGPASPGSTEPAQPAAVD